MAFKFLKTFSSRFGIVSVRCIVWSDGLCQFNLFYSKVFPKQTKGFIFQWLVDSLILTLWLLVCLLSLTISLTNISFSLNFFPHFSLLSNLLFLFMCPCTVVCLLYLLGLCHFFIVTSLDKSSLFFQYAPCVYLHKTWYMNEVKLNNNLFEVFMNVQTNLLNFGTPVGQILWAFKKNVL